MPNSIRAFSVVFLCGVFLFTSCKDNPTSFSDEPPQIPSEQSMTMDMSQFEDQDSQQKAGESPSVQAENPFLNAALRAAIIKVVVDVNLAIPGALLEAASSADAELNSEGEWVWTYSHTAGEQSFEVRLVASQGDDDQIQWEFFVTSTELDLTDRLFFSGAVNSDGTGGVWTYYNLDTEASDEAVSRVEWSVNGEDDVQLRLEVLSDRNNNEGDYIEYTFDGTIKYAVYYDASEEDTTEIQWNVETHAGFLIAPDYNNGEKACWNSDLVDVSCVEV